MNQEKMAEIFRQIAQLLELKGENTFKIRAYSTGADVVETFPGDLMERARNQDLKGIKGLGDALQQKVHEMATTGKLEFFEKLQVEFPEKILELFEVQGLGPKKIKLLWDQLQVGSIADLKRVCESGEIAALPGFAKKTVEKLQESLAFRESHASEFRQEQVAPWVEAISSWLSDHPDVGQFSIAGSYRRGKETVHDLDFLVSSKQGAALLEEWTKQTWVSRVLGQGDTKASVLLPNGLQCDMRVVETSQFPFALQYFSGSKEHNVVIRQRALQRGLSLNEYGFSATNEKGEELLKNAVIHEEREIYRLLDLDYIEPELRENTGEIEAAEKGKLPRLVELSQLRGVFHNHTTESDGVATLAQMAEAAVDLGWEYLGIADHSKSSFQANGLTEERLLAQIQEIQTYNASQDDIYVFAGNEVDILKDGRLDFEDEILAQLEYVVASVHQSFTLPEEEMTRRLIKAMENPYVTMLGHATGRLLLQRPAYALNLSKIIDAAAETETIIELNANPWRLDMDWRWWKYAKDKGVLCSINPDAHRTEGFQDVFYGTRIARKGWLSKENVINCLKLDEVKVALQKKRQKFL